LINLKIASATFGIGGAIASPPGYAPGTGGPKLRPAKPSCQLRKSNMLMKIFLIWN